MWKVAVAVIGSAIVLQAGGLTEPNAIACALRRNTSIRVSAFEAAGDSLNLVALRAQWLPAAKLDASVQAPPRSDAAASSSISIAGTQTLPGGGTVSASVARGDSLPLSGNPSSSTYGYGISALQPVLRDAWSNAPTEYSIRIALLDHRQFTLNQKKTLASTISMIRDAYWDYYAAIRLLQISRRNVDYTAQQLEQARVGFRVGVATMLDTVSAALDMLKAKETMMNSDINTEQARLDLARNLGIPADSLMMPDSLDIAAEDPPEAREFVAMVRAYDPDLAIFDVLKRKIEAQLANQRNRYLPSMAIGATYYHSEPSAYDASIANNAVIKLILSYAIPLTTTRIAVAQSRLSLQENELQRQDHEIELRDRIKQMIDTWKHEKEKLTIAQRALEYAQQAFNASSKGYEVGTVDRLALEKARNDLFGQSVTLLQQQIALKKLEITFHEISGAVFARFGIAVD